METRRRTIGCPGAGAARVVRFSECRRAGSVNLGVGQHGQVLGIFKRKKGEKRLKPGIRRHNRKAFCSKGKT
jgi:hypothetical protein